MNYCTVDDLVDRFRNKVRYFQRITEPVGLCPTDDENWWAIVRLFRCEALKLPGEWLPVKLWKIRLKKQDVNMVNEFLAEACKMCDILYEDLIGTDVKLDSINKDGGSIIVVDSL